MGTAGRRGGYHSRGQVDGVFALEPSVWAALDCASTRRQERRLRLPQAFAGSDGSGGQRVHLALRRRARGLKLSPAATSTVATKRRTIVQGNIQIHPGRKLREKVTLPSAQKQCFGRCVRQCLCSHVRQAAALVPRPPSTCGDVTLVDHRMVVASQPALLFLGQMAGGGVDTPCFRKSQILALCSPKKEPSSCSIYMHKNRFPRPPVWER